MDLHKTKGFYQSCTFNIFHKLFVCQCCGWQSGYIVVVIVVDD